MSEVHTPVFERVEVWDAATIDAFRTLNLEYFTWMADELSRHCALRFEEITGLNMESYVERTVELSCSMVPLKAILMLLRTRSGDLVGMGGLRRLPDGAAEIVRIFMRPSFRGHRFGTAMVERLITEAELSGYEIIRLDTAVFMESAQRIYRHAGFQLRPAYAGAEPPAVLQPYWLYMERPVRIDVPPGSIGA